MDDPSIFIIISILVIISGLLSGAESALLSLPESRIRAMREEKIRGIHFLEFLKAHQKQVIITILLGSNTVNILIPTLGTIWVTNTYGETQFADIAMGISTFVLTFLVLFFGEIVPKSFAVTYSEKFSVYVSPIIYFLTKVLTPLVWIFEKLSDLVTPQGSANGISEQEVLAMVSMSEEHGDITAEEKTRIKNLLEFSDTTVARIMTPRNKIESLEENQSLSEAREFFLNSSHTRIPVYSEDLDHITDIITLRDILGSSTEHADEKLIKNIELRTPYIIPITKKISSLFAEFQRQRIHMAIVMDEHGGTAGLVTMEDIFEEIFGDIHDETDIEDSSLQKVNEKTWKLSPQMTVEEVFEETKILISTDDENTDKSLSLLILEKLERFPRKGEIVNFEGADLVIEKIDEKRIEQIRMVLQ